MSIRSATRPFPTLIIVNGAGETMLHLNVQVWVDEVVIGEGEDGRGS